MDQMMTKLGAQWLCLLSCFISYFCVAKNTEVEVYQPTSQRQYSTIKLTGSIEAIQNSSLAPLQAGVVKKIFVDSGTAVKKGDELLQLDATLATLQLQALEAGATAAQVSFNEAQRLFDEVITLSKKQHVAKTLMSEREANLASAKANHTEKQASVVRQREIVERHILKAPYDGIIAWRNADLGEWVSQQSEVFNLVSNQNLRLKIAIPQEYYSQVDNSPLSIRISIDHDNQLTFTSNSIRLVSVSDPQTRTLIGLIELPKHPGLIAGMSAQAEIMLNVESLDQIWLPKTAIKQHPDGGNSVFAVIDNRAQRVLVKVQQEEGEQVAVTGASAEYAYIVKGIELIKDNAPVTVIKKMSKEQ